MTTPASLVPPSGVAPGSLHASPEQLTLESKQTPVRQVEKASQGTSLQSGSIVIGMARRVWAANVKRRRATMQPLYAGGLQADAAR